MTTPTKDPTDMGMNRTGIQTSPVLSKELIEAARASVPSSPGGSEGIAQVRAEYARESGPMGTMPPPTKLKGIATSAMTAMKGEKPTVLLDKIGARLAFERTGVRLYEALLSKFDIYGTWEGGPTREQLEEIRVEELRHFGLLLRALETLGADSTVMTPSANLQANISQGVPKVMDDPRTNLRECLEAATVIELVDNDSWDQLVRLARAYGQDKLADEFTEALEREQVHLSLVRTWMNAGLGAESGAEVSTAPSTL